MLHRIERLLLDLAVIAIIGLGFLITLTVVLRATVNSSVPDTIVIVRELMVAAIVLPLAAATTERAHIVVEFLSKMMSQRTQDRLVVAGSLFGVVALSPLIWAGWNEVAKTVGSGTFYFGQLNLPKWPGRVIFLIGITFCALRLLLMALDDIRTIRAGGHPIPPDTTQDLMEEA
ncbi:TRAP transporter small permease [Jannaschia rubra]|uniref:TRAP transporter small permease protein n=1 Tax=Jannaschia rubra TaxID=282197 RepID=A0A0M6XSX5_9RHOB|nr:TRAP transporter small permease [Jannaschia rubra]CTQ33331.1 TRAP-type C4-dicarboxylate transport system, small permease component [Jannaschia rubra]SFF99374.1 TRAP-type C4-dicarboxylate transport system, small permease component [Jannaschia rubra]